MLASPPRSHALPLAALVTLITSCGAGTIGILSSGSSSSSKSDVGVGQVEITGTKIGTTDEPALITVRFSGSGSKDATADLRYRVSGGPTQSIPGGSLTGSGGQSKVFEWAFTEELGLDNEVLRDVLLWADVPGQGDPDELNSVTLNLGNEAPELTELELDLVGGAARDLVPIHFVVADRGGLGPDTPAEEDGDRVSIYIEIQPLNDQGQPVGSPFSAWPGGSDEPPPPGRPALDEVLALTNGTPVTFFWDSAADLPQMELDVRLRIYARDFQSGVVVSESEPDLISVVPVDNNEEPIAVLSPSFVANPDQRRGLPVPVTITDPEEDEVTLVVQWSRELGEFPDLPPASEISALLADPEASQALRIARPWPLAVQGRTGTSNESHVVLPELGAGGQIVLDEEVLTGQEAALLSLEILDPSLHPRPALAVDTETPSMALPLGRGPMALLLDNPGDWRIRQIDLFTGEGAELATGTGFGTSMTLSPDGSRLFVAMSVGNQWRVQQWRFEDGQLSDPVTRMPPTSFDADINGITSLGRDVALVSVGEQIVRLDFAPGGGVATIIDGIVGAWGLDRHPFLPGRFFVAERGPARIRVIDLRGERVVETYMGIEGLEQPETLAVSADGSKLFVVVKPGAFRELRAFPLDGFGHGESFVVIPELPEGTWRMAVGPEGRLCLTAEQYDAVYTGGGVLQERMITAFDPTTRRVEVNEAFSTPPEPGSPWRIRRARTSLRSSATGRRGIFVWDSREVPGGGEVYLRVTPVDSDLGFAGETDTARLVLPPMQGGQFALNTHANPDLGDAESVAVGDLDGDGDLDIVSAIFTGGQLSLFRQLEGSFEVGVDGSPSWILDQTQPAQQIQHPIHVITADVDGDGLEDIVCSDMGLIASFDGIDTWGRIHLYRQDPTNMVTGFTHSLLGGPGSDFVTNQWRARWVEAMDLDDDGDLDLVVADRHSDSLLIFHQGPGGLPQNPTEVLTDGAHLIDPAMVTVGDLDSDGVLDLVAPSEGTNEVVIYLGLEGEAFAAERSIVLGPGPGTTESPWRVLVADIDGDGRLDVLCSNEDSDDLNLWYQNEPGASAFGSGASPIVPDEVFTGFASVPQLAQGLATADLDGDGRTDIITANRQTDNVSLHFQVATRLETTNGHAHFDLDPVHHVLGNGLVTGSPRGLVTADMEGDGDPDVVLSTAENRISVFLHVSISDFATSSADLGGSGITSDLASLTSGDFDRDGDVDLVSANHEASSLTLFRQESVRSFTLPTVFPLAEAPVDVTSIDLDGDGDLDLLAALHDPSTAGGPAFALYPGSSAGFPQDPVLVDAGIDSLVGLVAGDFDGDDELEVIGIGDGQASYWEPGTGTVTTKDYAQLEDAQGVHVSDLDRDGWLDLVVQRDTDRVTVLWGTGLGAAGSFLLQNLPPPGAAPGSLYSVGLGDVDGDGALDVYACTTAGDEGRAAVWYQDPDSPRSFQATALPEHSVSGELRSVTAIDVDRDGTLDLVVGQARTPVGSSSLDGFAVFRQVAPRAFVPDPYRVPDGNGTVKEPFLLRGLDVDQDGDLDIVALNRGTDTITIHYGAF